MHCMSTCMKTYLTSCDETIQNMKNKNAFRSVLSKRKQNMKSKDYSRELHKTV